jgi:3-hydroxyisobutyrate dehydrogenase-like beta-hydroxyacid dehydrogenase
MQPDVVGLLSPGEMGAAIGATLRRHGVDVVTCLEGRSDLTRTRAEEAGLREVSTLNDLVRESTLVLSVLVPSEALDAAGAVAAAIQATRARPVVADCNAVSPRTVEHMASVITAAGGWFIDAGIIGGPPREGAAGPRIYCSGPDCAPLLALREYSLDVRAIGDTLGRASGLKMVYAASTKGTTALWTELLVAARAMGLADALAEELVSSRGGIAAAVSAGIPSMPRRARRWVGDMEEIAATFEEVGLTPRMLQGAADLYLFVGHTRLAERTSRDPDPPLDEVLDTLAGSLGVLRGGPD